jgi:DMSO reductase anchor subunit/ferredoxin
VDAYSKDPVTGIVLHSAEACIGCQYCTWNCSYGVPQYNPERGVVGKCDMCYGRLAQGQTSACAAACPTGAIQIEIIATADWRENYAAANAPGMPPAHHSLSTTRISQPKNLPPDIERVNLNRLRLEHAHWPLVFMTVLTQFSVGAFAALWLLESTGHQAGLRLGGAASLLIALIALGASTLHLGRPIHAYRAMKMWRRSWLSREVLLFSIFAVVASLCSGAMFYEPRAVPLLAALTVVAGVAGVGSSARVYMVPGRPSWNSGYTAAEFALTSIVMGILFLPLFPNSSGGLRYAGLAAGLAIMLTTAAKFFRLHRSRRHELRATARLLSTVLATHLFWRIALMAAALAVAYSAGGRWSAIAALLLAAGSELLGRYLFFVSVVPTNIAAGYLAAQEAA